MRNKHKAELRNTLQVKHGIVQFVAPRTNEGLVLINAASLPYVGILLVFWHSSIVKYALSLERTIENWLHIASKSVIENVCVACRAAY